MSDRLLITEAWLKAVGFRSHQLERQASKHWLLWLGNAIAESERYEGQQWIGFTGFDDRGVEIAGHSAPIQYGH